MLLIAAYLDPASLRDLHALIRELGMAALVEVHTQAELEAVLPLQPALVGINNRDLQDFTVRLETTLDLRPLVPAGVCLVAESGIHTAEDVRPPGGCRRRCDPGGRSAGDGAGCCWRKCAAWHGLP